MKQRLLPLLLVALGIFFISHFSAATQAAPKRQIVILDIPRFNLAEMSRTQEYPNWNKLLANSATGLVAFAAPTLLTPDEVYLFFNSGVLLKAPPEGYPIYDATEVIPNMNGINAKDFFRSLTGRRVSSRSAINININEVTTLNAADLGTAKFLGQVIHKHHGKTAVIGNCDTDQPARLGATLLMDASGRVDYGAVGSETLRRDPGFPYGIRSDATPILKYYRLFKKRAAVTVITLGDLERIEQFQANLSQGRKEYYRKLALRRYDKFIGRLLRQTDFRSTELIVFSCLPPQPFPVEKELAKNGLTAVAIKGPGFDGGVLYTPTTRRAGIITYPDLRQNVIQYLKAFPGTSAGLRSKPGQWRALAREQEALVQNYAVRWPLLTAYGVLLIGLFGLMIFGLLLGFAPRVIHYANILFLVCLAMPAAFLLESLFNPLDWPAIIGLTVGLTLLIFLPAYWAAKGKPLPTLGWISLVTAALILLDSLFNGYSESKSFLGYSLVSGARFYGVGNEYLGVLFGSFIVAVSVGQDRDNWRQRYLWIAVALISIILFHPFWGAKVGGGLTALIGLGVTVCLWRQRPVRMKEITKLTAAAFLALIITGLWDLYMNRNGMSHLGQLLWEIKKGGMGVFFAMALRKLEMNWQLILYTPLNFVLIGILAAVPLLNKYPPARLQETLARARARYPKMVSGFIGLCITALVALVLNDTGIVAAATMFMYGTAMILQIWIANRGGWHDSAAAGEYSDHEK